MTRHQLVPTGIVLFTVAATTSLAAASELQKFTVAGSERQGLMGFAATISGDIGFAGAPAGTSKSGIGYIFDAATGAPMYTLTPSVANTKDMFGFNAKILESNLLVGDPGNPGRGTPAGAAYVFNVNSGRELMRLQPEDGFAGDEFGFGINLQGETAIIGAPNLGSGPGSAYLFDVGNGDQLRKLTADDAFNGAEFGFDVAIGDRHALVGAPGNFDALGFVPGAAYVFDVETGDQLNKLAPSRSFGGDEFGFDVAIHGDLALVGAPNGGSAPGAAFLFDLTTGRELFELKSDDSADGDNFGGSVDIQDGLAVVGASGLNNVLGSAYVFDILSGRQIDKLVPTDIEDGDNFGTSVSISNRRVLIGSPGDDDTTLNAGAAYLFGLALPGDFNGDGLLDAQDINRLTDAVKSQADPAVFDVTGDGFVDQSDRIMWVNELANTFFGDANLDGEFNSGDLVKVLQEGEYNDEVHGNSGWHSGDFNGDCEFDSGDLIAALQAGAYDTGPRPATLAVPEPSGLTLVGLGMCLLAIRFETRKRMVRG